MKLFFNHIPKAGGVSVHDILSSVFGRFYANLNTNGFDQIGRSTSHDALTRYTRSPNLLALGAHVQSPEEFIRAELLDACLNMSIVRDPVARLGSYYGYVKRSPHLPYYKLANKLDFDAFFDRLNEDETINLTMPAQRAQLMYEITIYPSGTLGERETVEAVRRYLERHYLLVGVTERMDLFYDRLQTMLRTLLHRPDLTIDAVHSNRTGGGTSSRLSPENQRFFHERAYTDMNLHAWLLEQGVFYNEPLVDEFATLFR